MMPDFRTYRNKGPKKSCPIPAYAEMKDKKKLCPISAYTEINNKNKMMPSFHTNGNKRKKLQAQFSSY